MPKTHTQASSPEDIKHARLVRCLNLLCGNVDQFIRTSRHPALSGERWINSEDVSEAAGLLRELGLAIQADRLERGYGDFVGRLLTMRLDAPNFHLLDAQVQSDMHLITHGLAGELAEFLRELRSDLSKTHKGSKANSATFVSADTLAINHGIRQSRLSETASAGLVETQPAEPGTKDSQGKDVRQLYHQAQAIQNCGPKKFKRRRAKG